MYKFLKDKNNLILKDKKDRPVINKEFKIEEKIPLNKKIEEYLEEEVDPYISDYNYDKKKVLIGYQIDFIRYFYEFNTTRPANKIKEELDVINKKIQEGFKID